MDQETVPFWVQGQSVRSYPPLDKNKACDVCVVGAGIAGLMTAFLLSKEGKKVVVLDDGAVAGGQTMRTTAHLANSLDDRYYNLESYFGTIGAKLAAESHKAAIDLVASLVKEHAIDCDFHYVNAYLFVPPNDSHEELKKEFAAAQRAGLDVKMVERCPWSSFDTKEAICFGGQGEFHPLKFINKLCSLIEAQQGEIYGSTHAAHIESQYIVHTDKKYNVTATHLVIATNSPINYRYFPHLKQSPYRTYVIAGKIPPGTLEPGLYYDTPDPYHYLRIYKDSAGNETLIVGGEDHRTAEEKFLAQKFKLLEAWTRNRFPTMQEVTHRWSGQILEPVDSLGFIGKVEKESYIITGDSGNGITHGILGGMLINDLIHKRHSTWAELYNPHRITFKTTLEFIAENANSAWQYKDWFTSGENKDLKPHCGRVVREGIHKCALYKDEEGEIHKMSAVCPHLQAIVHWNEVEHCWECPAHGSRFNALGEVIQGPANENLKKL